CPHHGFLELHQLDTFYNALNSKDQDSLNSVAGGNFLDKMPRECLAIIESKSKVRYSRNKPVVAKVSMNTSTSGISPDVAEFKDMVKALLLDKKSQNQAPATVKAVKESCVTYGGAHSYRNCPAIDGNIYRDNIQEFVSQASAVNYNQGNTSYRPPMIASTLSSDILPSNTIANPRSDLKTITTRSGVSYDGPQIPPPPYFLPKVVENELEATKDTVHPTNNGSTEDVQPLVVQSESLILNSEPVNSLTIETVKLADRSISRSVGVAGDVYVKVGTFHFPTDFVVVDFDADPRVPLILGRSFLKTGRALIDVFEGELTLRVGKEAITFNLDQTSRYSANYNEMTTKRIDVIDMACEEYSLEGDILLLEAFLNDDPSSPPPNQENYLPEVRKELKICKAKSDKSSIDEPPKVELKDLPPHLEYAFLEGDDKLPVIIAKDLSVEEKTALITVLKSHKRAIAWKLSDMKDSNKLPVIIAKNLKVDEREALLNVLKSHKWAIAWKISDIKGIDPRFCTHKILMENNYKPAVKSQRRVNPKIHDVIKKEVIKLLDAKMIYPISDSPWVSPIHCVPKKEGITVVANENNELIPTRLVLTK
nr:reverse transcriptase domain-containing protein [Tanacetum cinerariifolium]